ncbi:hypothetical protein P154DRAFT_579837 [Amniculicola lignicola CBS 123094]|uniref:Uncharacterized protein n=1 Tax=Amniculicola lignicola CBS 123094 TaxID=1392246 RepID=A0A6A5W661_9PLEO|nr:hypothetical protein P154DRAFT_579837 [Amniculicola lignicola CBS 123094]
MASSVVQFNTMYSASGRARQEQPLPCLGPPAQTPAWSGTLPTFFSVSMDTGNPTAITGPATDIDQANARDRAFNAIESQVLPPREDESTLVPMASGFQVPSTWQPCLEASGIVVAGLSTLDVVVARLPRPPLRVTMAKLTLGFLPLLEMFTVILQQARHAVWW